MNDTEPPYPAPWTVAQENAVLGDFPIRPWILRDAQGHEVARLAAVSEETARRIVDAVNAAAEADALAAALFATGVNRDVVIRAFLEKLMGRIFAKGLANLSAGGKLGT